MHKHFLFLPHHPMTAATNLRLSTRQRPALHSHHFRNIKQGNCSSVHLKGSCSLQQATQILHMILEEVSVLFFSFLSLLFSSLPISQLIRDSLYLLGLFLLHSSSNTEKSEIKAVVPRQVTLHKQANTEPRLYKLRKRSSNLNPAQHQDRWCDTVKSKSKQTRLQSSVNTNFRDYKSQHQYPTVMHMSEHVTS